MSVRAVQVYDAHVAAALMPLRYIGVNDVRRKAKLPQTLSFNFTIITLLKHCFMFLMGDTACEEAAQERLTFELLTFFICHASMWGTAKRKKKF